LLWWDSGRATQNKDVADSIGSEVVKLQPDIIIVSAKQENCTGK